MELSRPGYWSGLPFCTPGDLPDAEIEPCAAAAVDLQHPLRVIWVESEALCAPEILQHHSSKAS